MSIDDARIHLDEAIRLLTLRATRIDMDGTETPNNDMCNITEELDRIDRAIGPRGESMFARLGEVALQAFTEIKAARAALAP
jgi:hypothetical protein